MNAHTHTNAHTQTRTCTCTHTHKVTRQCPHTTTFEERGEPKQNQTRVLLLATLVTYL